MSLAGVSPLDDVASRHPEWHVWLALYREARAACDEAAWREAAAVTPHEAAGAPLIAGAVLTVDPGRARPVVRALMERAFTLDGAALDGATAVRVLEAAVNDDRPALSALAEGLRLAPALFAEVAALAAMPLLQAYRQAWSARAPSEWLEAACPLCGAWAALAEARGLERALRLRCGRCGADWAALPVRCAFCGTAEHDKLGALVSERGADLRRVETCSVCLGYMKTVTTLQACAPADVRLLDVDTVELDVAALEHGFARPARAPRRLDVRLVARARRGLAGLFARGR
ncbi:MAG TPA: formate dehydrogenase accessory protein FdhE [Terriglobales bacterium]|nr:formate dehydrogenase accessory protein FdhE [Terriglobales bacterium]